MRKCWKSKVIRGVICVLLVIALSMISLTHMWIGLDRLTFGLEKLSTIAQIYTLNGELHGKLNITPTSLATPINEPSATSILHADGFAITMPFLLQSVEERNGFPVYNYDKIEVVTPKTVPSSYDLPPLPDDQTEHEMLIASMKARPIDLWLATTPKQLFDARRNLSTKFLTFNAEVLPYYAEQEDIIAFMTKGGLGITNTLTKHSAAVIIKARDSALPLTEDEIAYILNHIEPAPRWEEDNP